MKAVQLAVNAFIDRVMGEALALMSDNITVAVYVKKQGEQYLLPYASWLRRSFPGQS